MNITEYIRSNDTLRRMDYMMVYLVISELMKDDKIRIADDV